MLGGRFDAEGADDDRGTDTDDEFGVAFIGAGRLLPWRFPERVWKAINASRNVRYRA